MPRCCVSPDATTRSLQKLPNDLVRRSIIRNRRRAGGGKVRHGQPRALADLLGIDLDLNGFGDAALREDTCNGVVSDVVRVGLGAAADEVDGIAADGHLGVLHAAVL